MIAKEPTLMLDTLTCGPQLATISKSSLSSWPLAFCAAICRAEDLRRRNPKAQSPSTAIMLGGIGFILTAEELPVGQLVRTISVRATPNLAQLMHNRIAFESPELMGPGSPASEQPAIDPKNRLSMVRQIIQRGEAPEAAFTDVMSVLIMRSALNGKGQDLGRFAEPLRKAIKKACSGFDDKNFHDSLRCEAAAAKSLLEAAENEMDCVANA